MGMGLLDRPSTGDVMQRRSVLLLVLVTLGIGGCSSEDGPFGPGGTTTPSGGVGAQGGAAGSGGVGASGGQGGTAGFGGSGGGGGALPITDFAQPGPFGVSSEDGEFPVPGCGLLDDTLNYTLYVPDGAESAPLVMLGHGFERSRGHMVQLAEHMASHGVRVAALDYCDLSIGDIDYPQNAADQVALAADLAAGAPVIHAGYSAGGLVTFLAVASDPSTIALLALDAVDNQGQAAAVAGGIGVPAFGIDGEPSSCNQNNNGGTFLAKLVPGGWALRAVGATHCDFEGPTNWVCTSVCGGEGQEGQREIIRALAAAFVAWQAGVDPSGEDWVTAAGGTYQSLETAGSIATL